MSSRDEMQRLEEAAAAFLQFRATGGSAEEFLGRHPHLRDLLEPMLAGTEAPAALVAVSGFCGRTLGDFRLQREIGRGGMGVVFAAQQLSLDRRVAVKVLPQSVALQANAIVRFKREAGVAARLQHEGIVEIYAVGATDELHWFAMELVDGLGLDQVIAECRSVPVETLDGGAVRAILDRRLGGAPRGATPVRSASRMGGYVASVIDIVTAVADALEHAHQAGVIHRDVKPSNILLRADGRPVLTDFGLAREEGLPSISRTGEFAGTPYYVAPEQAQLRSREVDRRADVFALGVTLYELLTLSRPFEGETTQVVLQRILTREPPDPRRRNRNLSEDLVAVLMKALEKEPARRYQTAAAFAGDLRAVLALQPVVARRWTRSLRLRQWLRREPLKAALIGVLAAGVPALLVLGGYVLSNQPQIAAGKAKLSEPKFEALLAEGFQKMSEHQFEAAAAAMRQALELVPDSPEAIAGLTLAERNRAGFPSAVLVLDGHPDVLHATPALQRLRASLLADRDTSRLGVGDDVSALELFLAGMNAFDQYWPKADRVADAQRAFKYFDDAVVRAPRARAIYLLFRAHAAAAAKDARCAVQSVDALLSMWPDAPHMWGSIGYLLEDIDVARATAAFRRALTESPDDALLHTDLGVVLRKVGDDAGAKAEFERALQLDPKLAGAHLRLAALLFDTGHAEESLAYYQSNAEVSNDPHEYVGWAESCLRLGKIDPGLEVFEHALKTWPDNAELHHGYGNALRMAKRLDEAADHLRRACELDPRSAGAWYTLGAILQTKRDPACMDAYAKVLELKPDHPAAMDAMGRELMQQEHFVEAVDVLQKAVACKPDYARAQSALGMALLRAGRCNEAAVPLQKAEELDKANIANHRRACRQFAKNPELRAAVIVLCRVDLQRDPAATESHALLVDALRGRGDYLGVAEELRRWAKVRENDAAAQRALAAFLLDADLPKMLRDPPAALGAAKRAVELAGDDVQNGLVLADALFASGDPEAALRQLDAVADKAAAAGLGERLAEQRRRFGAR